MLKIYIYTFLLLSPKICEGTPRCIGQSMNGTRMDSEENVISKILTDKECGYDRKVRPRSRLSGPIQINVNVHINTVNEVDQQNMLYTIDIYLRQYWTDVRLTLDNLTRPILLHYDLIPLIWLPDLFITNEIAGYAHVITVPNRYIKIFPNGKLLYSQRLTLTLTCQMHLQRFPMDVQKCRFQMESYGHTTDEIIFVWDKSAVRFSKSVKLPDYIVKEEAVSSGDCTAVYVTGNFTCIYSEMKLERQISYYFICAFIPDILIVILSWVSFWIDTDAAPARVSLGLLTVLTITTHIGGISSRLPPVGYIKAIDVWQSTCLIFVFGALLEYALVNTLSRKYARKIDQECKSTKSDPCVKGMNTAESKTLSNSMPDSSACTDRQGSLSNISDVFEKHYENMFKLVIGKNVNKTADRSGLVDRISQVAFPVCFIVFNIVYWNTYLLAE